MMIASSEEKLFRPVLLRLRSFRNLSDDAAGMVQSALRQKIVAVGVGEDLVSEGDRADIVRVFLSGWACRYKVLEDGRRQIVSFILPGDTCDAHIYLVSRMDHSIAALTPVTCSIFERAAFDQLIAADTVIAEALYCETLANNAVQREWTVNLGQREAIERVAHVICELFLRLNAVGLTDGYSFAFPVTQMDLADAAGLSTVHVNRTLQQLRALQLITLRDRQLVIHDFKALSTTAMFTPEYLHLDNGKAASFPEFRSLASKRK